MKSTQSCSNIDKLDKQCGVTSNNMDKNLNFIYCKGINSFIYKRLSVKIKNITLIQLQLIT